MSECRKTETAVGVDLAALVDAFNDAYSAYPIPVAITRNQLEFLLRHRNFQPALSAVIRSPADRIDAFWLTGAAPAERPGETYAIALGVRPERTGAGLARTLFAQIANIASNAGYKSVALEVLEANERARRLYDALGFVTNRRVECFRDRIAMRKRASVKTAPATLDDLLAFVERSAQWAPTWQNAAHALRNIEGDLDIRRVLEGGACVAAGALIRPTQTIAQLVTAKAFRRRGCASAIVVEWARTYGGAPLTVLNIDGEAEADLAFYRSCGFKHSLTQLEMTAPLASLST